MSSALLEALLGPTPGRDRDRAVVLAVDGGNSKTDLALVRADGALLAMARGPLSSPHHVGLDGCLRVLEDLLAEAMAAAGLPAEQPVAEVGHVLLAGADLPVEERALQEAIRRAAGRCARRSATTRSRSSAPAPSAGGESPSCAAPASTASAWRPTAVTCASPRSGTITGDWGGGHDVGLAAVSAAARSEDGRGPKTTLERACPAHFGLSAPRELAEAIHLGADPGAARCSSSRRWSSPRPQRDAVAAEIVDRLAAEVVALARAAVTRLSLARRAGRGPARRRAHARGQRAPGGGDRRRPARGGPADHRARRARAADRRRGAARPRRARRRRRGARPPARASWPSRRPADELATTGSTTMSEVRFEQATKLYAGNDEPAVDALDLRDPRRRADGARRAVGIGQVDGAADARGPRGGRRRRRVDRRATTSPTCAPKDRDVAMVFQNYALYPYLDVAANLAFPLKMARVEGRARRGACARSPSCSTSRRTCERKPAQLSGGQRQRVAMGRAIIREPAVFLMDEPLSNLDAKLRVQMRAEIAALQARLGVTTVYVTHDQVEAMTLGHRVAVLRDGRLQQCDTPRRSTTTRPTSSSPASSARRR